MWKCNIQKRGKNLLQGNARVQKDWVQRFGRQIKGSLGSTFGGFLHFGGGERFDWFGAWSWTGGLWSPSSTVPRPLAPIRPLIPPDPSNDVERFRVTAAGIGNTSSNGGFDPRFGSHSIPGKGVPWLVGKRWGGTKVLMCWKGTSQEMWELQLDKHK